MSIIVKDILEALNRIHRVPVIACDTEKAIAAKGISKDEVLNRQITVDMEKILERREAYAHDADNDSYRGTCNVVSLCDMF